MTHYAWFVRGAEHAKLCRQSINSVRKIDPKAGCFVITDEVKPEWLELVDCGVAQLQQGQSMMMANIEAQLAACSLVPPATDLWFLDTDILLRAPLPPLRGDLTVTWRDHVGVNDQDEKIEGVAAEMPYNYGVMGFMPGMPTFEALIWMRERVRKMSPNHRQWYGNQLALAELAGPVPTNIQSVTIHRHIPWSLTEGGRIVEITRLACDGYNYTPKSADDDVSFKTALHFKGHARKLMQGFAEAMGVA
jgi:hypothetical protein